MVFIALALLEQPSKNLGTKYLPTIYRSTLDSGCRICSRLLLPLHVWQAIRLQSSTAKFFCDHPARGQMKEVGNRNLLQAIRSAKFISRIDS